MAKTAIVVDDVPFARRVIKDILMANKITVLAEASNGDEAISLFKKYKPDIVTMDVVMPHKGGIEAIRHIIDDDKAAKIIIVSAMSHEHLLMDAINAGAKDYILKPFTAEDLMRSIEKVFADDEAGNAKQPNAKGGVAHEAG